ncbi:MAG: hypothetical protein BYD32DRAFT_466777 [Podila humilis]|nr:MAG: hypothetical protein BYD32DRAFT_466777 [Podila humilis]
MNLSALMSRTSLRPFGVTIPTISVTRLCTPLLPLRPSQVQRLLRVIKDAVFYAASPNAPQHLAHHSFLGLSSPVFIPEPAWHHVNERTGGWRFGLFDVRLYVGGGLGTDLSRGLSIEHAYVVCIMSWHSVSSFNSSIAIPSGPLRTKECNIYDSPVTMDKISLPAVFSGPLSQPSPSSSTPTIPTTRSAPRTLQPDLSSSSFGAFFGVQSPPSSIKGPLTDMAASQVRNRDIDSRHQDHQQHQASQPSYPEPTPPLTGIKLQLQIMPSDHPPVDPTDIVYGSQQRKRLQQI